MSYVAVEIPEDRLLLAIAEEDAVLDRDLDAIERELLEPSIDSGRAAALALMLGRAGRPTSREALSVLAATLEARGRTAEVGAVRIAIDLLAMRPSRVERADRGYRWRDPKGGAELFVEDPIAAHWHHRGRWGPPLRVDVESPVVVARDERELSRFVRAVRAGEIVLVYFSPAHRLARPEAPLRLMRAGLSRDASLTVITRWSRVRSVGEAERRSRAHPAYETGDVLEVLPERASISVAALIELMTQLLKQART